MRELFHLSALIALFFLIFSAVPGIPSEKLTTRIKIETTGEKVRISLFSSQILTWRAEHKNSPDSLVLHISPIDKDPHIIKEVPVNVGLVRKVKFTFRGEDELLIIVRVVSLPHYEIKELDGKKGLALIIDREMYGHSGRIANGKQDSGKRSPDIQDLNSPRLKKIAILFETCRGSSAREIRTPPFEEAPVERLIRNFRVMLDSMGESSLKAIKPPIEDASAYSIKDNLSIVLDAASRGNLKGGLEGSKKDCGEEMISMEFTSTELVKILKLLAEKIGLNLITSPNIKEKKSIMLTDMTADEAIPLVLKGTGYSYKVTSDTLFIGPSGIIDSLTPEALMYEGAEDVIRVFVLRNKRIEKVLSSFEKEFPGINIEPNASLNAFIVTARVSLIKKIEDFIKSVDMPEEPGAK